jgi:hypothetical protein
LGGQPGTYQAQYIGSGVDAALHRPVVPAREEKEPTKAAQKTIRRAILKRRVIGQCSQPQSWGGFPAGSMIVITSLEPP